MNYTLNQLKVFLKVSQLGSVTKAAEELHLTQPAVSIQLKNFQHQFDIPLMEVIGRKIYITDFGKEITIAVEDILNQVNAIDSKVKAFNGKLTGKLRIAVVSTGKYVMPFFLSDFIRQHDGVELVMDVTNKQRVIQSIENNEVDFALVSVLPLHLAIDKIDLLPNKLFLVGQEIIKHNKNAEIKEIFQNIPLIIRESGSATRDTMERFIQKNNIKLIKKIELTSNEAVKQAVLAGLGYSIMPLIGIKNEIISKDLIISSIKGLPLTTNWSLIWSKNKKHSPVSQSFINHLEVNKNKIIQQHFSWYEDYLGRGK
jgi:DNA-binding transcriptional LysR family regulator